MDMALSDIKVVDLTHGIAGPYCTKMLGDYGADVIKVERPDGGDFARRLGPFPDDVPHLEKSGLFLMLNINKRGVTLNLKSAAGREAALRAAARRPAAYGGAPVDPPQQTVFNEICILCMLWERQLDDNLPKCILM